MSTYRLASLLSGSSEAAASSLARTTAARLARRGSRARSAITALTAAIPDLLEDGQEETAQLVQTTLEDTSVLPAGEELPKQLQLLFDVLGHPVALTQRQ